MKFYCNKSNLLNGLQIVQKAVSSRTTLPILNCILVESVNGMLRLIGNNLELGIETFIKSDIQEDGSIAVPSGLFFEIIRKLPEEDIQIEVDSNRNMYIKSGRANFTLKCEDAEEFPALPAIEEVDPIEVSQDLLKNMIKNTVFSIAQEQTRPILTGGLIEIDDENIIIVTLDGYRLSLRKGKISRGHKPVNVVVPGNTLNEISKIISDEQENMSIIFKENQVLFDLGYTRITSRLLEGEFINYRSIIDPTGDLNNEVQEGKTRVRIKTKDFLDSIERASLMSKNSKNENKNNLIKLNIIDDKIAITSDSEIGMCYEEVNAHIEGSDLEIAFNGRYIIDSLRAIDDDEIMINYTTNVSPCIVTPVDGDNFIYLILPVRIR